MPADTLLVLQASTTKTATFQGAALNLKSGVFPNQYLVARVIYSAASNASGANAVVFTVEASYDGGSTWGTIAGSGAGTGDIEGGPVNLSTTVQSGEQYIPFQVRSLAGTDVNIRLVATFSGAGTVPTITYQGDITPAFP